MDFFLDEEPPPLEAEEGAKAVPEPPPAGKESANRRFEAWRRKNRVVLQEMWASSPAKLSAKGVSWQKAHKMKNRWLYKEWKSESVLMG
eukprot:9793619-Karenia_brevis.AAC.1